MEHYADFRLLHIAAVAISATLFLLRGIGVQAGVKTAMAPPVRYLSYAVDTLLLGAALALVWTLREVILGSTWLWVKLALLPVYIVLGSFALKRAHSRRGKLLFFIAALATLVLMYQIARTHDPLGGLALYLTD